MPRRKPKAADSRLCFHSRDEAGIGRLDLDHESPRPDFPVRVRVEKGLGQGPQAADVCVAVRYRVLQAPTQADNG